MPDDYAEIDDEALPEGTASARRVQSELNIIEQILSGGSSTDNYLEAIVRNQRAQMVQSGIESVMGPSSPDNIPSGVIGYTVESIPNGQSGDVVFDIGGTRRSYTMRADGSVGAGTQIRSVGDGVFEAFSGGASVFVAADDYVVVESDDLDAVDDGGTVTVQPGETKTIVRARSRGQTMALLAVGANDESDVTYELVVDGDEVAGGTTNSPLGLLNEPFSFEDIIGGSIPANSRIEYDVTLAAGASASVEMAGRLHVNKNPGGL